jgi:hypothetical protein
VCHSILDDESLDPVRVRQGHAETHRAAVVLYVKRVARKPERFGEVIHNLVSVATSGYVRDQPKVADAASELLQDVLGKDKEPKPLGVSRCKPSARHPRRIDRRARHD